MKFLRTLRVTDDSGTRMELFRCPECASFVAEVDIDTHAGWHDEIKAWREALLDNVRAYMKEWKIDVEHGR